MRWTLSVLALLFLCPLVWSQDQLVEGIVTEQGSDEPVIGATILVEGTGTGTVTDIDGYYSLRVSGPDAVLVLSYTGFTQQRITVGAQSRLDIVMSGDVKLLDEVVVVGYGTQKRSNISGSVAIVSSEEINSSPVTRVEQALQGRTAGVQVAPVSGSPGSALTVRIRGVGTINNSDPLYIVDGVPVGGIDYLSPSDIESISVLKDAASAAIYGARGANGVVLITTKSAAKGKGGVVSYDNSWGFQEIARKTNLLSAREYAIISNESHINAGRSPLPQLADPDALGEGTDWLAAIFERAPVQNHQLSLSNSSDKSSFGISGSYRQQDGVIGGEKSSFERYTARVNGSSQVKDWLTIGSNLSFTYLERNGLPENNEFTTPLIRALNIDPITPVYKADGTYAYSSFADTDIANPVNAIAQTYDLWTTHRVVGSAYAELQPIEGLTIKSTYSVDATFATQQIFRPQFDLSVDTTLADAPAPERSLTNAVELTNNTWRNWQWETVASYNRVFAEDHNVGLVVGNTLLNSRFDKSGGSNTNLPSNAWEDAFVSNTIDPITQQAAFQEADENALLSYFGRVSYEYNDRYLFTATMRRDGSSRFGENNRFGYFPSFSAGWVVSRADFWKSKAVSFMKLRASWGQNGNNNIGNYPYTSVVNIGQNYVFGPGQNISSGAVPLTSANPDIKWETSVQTDIGIDVELWDGKVNFTGDYYVKETRDMLLRDFLPGVAGTEFIERNIGTMKNTGIELALAYRNRHGAFSYDLSGNISFVNTEVTQLGNSGNPVLSGNIQSANARVSRSEVGHPVAAFYGYVMAGLFQTSEEVASHAFQSEGTQAGDIRFVDLNNDGVIDENDQTFIGNPTPDYTYGFTANLAYKAFDLTIFLQGAEGNDIYNATTRYDFTYVNRPESVLDRWTGPGTSNFEPRVSLTDPNQNARVSDRFIEDGSYLRVKNLQLGYTLPERWGERLRIRKLRVFGGVQNLYTFTNYSGLDPEIGSYFDSPLEIGIDKGYYPQARTWLAGVQLTF